MTTERIHFTVSMWNRAVHLRKLCQDLQRVAQFDSKIALHVAFFDSDDLAEDEARTLVEETTTFPSQLIHLQQPFNNGHGHNVAAAMCPEDEIVCAVAVDVKLPEDICSRIRAAVLPGEQFYVPITNNQAEDGKLHFCEYAYALLAMYKQDLTNVGGIAENVKWGGDNDKRPEGGEDVVLARQLRKAGLKEIRPHEADIVCRWHPRDITSEFYSSLKRYGKKPWWTFTNSHGKPANFRS